MSQFLEVIEWTDPVTGEVLHRYPADGSAEIKMGAVCVVQEAQQAVFFTNGQAGDVLGPGRHTLSTENMPILTSLLSLPYGFKSTFRCAVYFVNTRVFTELRWGTRNPVTFRDKDLGLVRLRGYGLYTIRLQHPTKFLKELVGARATMNTTELGDYLGDVIVSRLNDLLGETFTSLLDLPRGYNELAAQAKRAIEPDFARYGLELVDFFVNSVTPPDEVQKVIDERSGLGAVGNLDDFVKFEAARAMGQSGSGVTGAAAQAGLGIGAAAGVAAALPGMMAAGLKSAAPAPGAAVCPTCHASVLPAARFCSSCGTGVAARSCAQCGVSAAPGTKFCSQCGTPLA